MNVMIERTLATHEAKANHTYDTTQEAVPVGSNCHSDIESLLDVE